MATREHVVDTVLAAASENSALLSKLSSTGEAPSVLRGHVAHVLRLEKSLSEQDEILQSLTEHVKTQYKVHKKFRDSKVRRFYHRATRMLATFQARAMNEEREYFATLARQSKAEDRRKQLQRELDEAAKAQVPLDAAVKEHQTAHEQIDALYESIFAGPTPGFDHEDERETAYYAAQVSNDTTKGRILTARRVLAQMGQSIKILASAESYMGYARVEAEESLFFLDDTIRGVNSSNRTILSASGTFDRATELLGPLSSELAAERRAVLYLLRAAHIRAEGTPAQAIIVAINTAQAKVDQAKQIMAKFQAEAKRREKAGLEEIRQTARKVEDSRQALQQIRQHIFEEVAGFGEAAPAYTEAPPYHECCDRTSQFCLVPEEPQDDDQREPSTAEEQTTPVELPQYEEPDASVGAGPASMSAAQPLPEKRHLAEPGPSLLPSESES